MGFFTAIPIGATQVEIAKRSLHNHLRAALMVMLGSVSSDVMYGFIALFGVAPFFNNPTVVAIFELVGAVILWILAFFTLRQSAQTQLLDLNHSFLRSRRISFVTGFSLAITNPMMIFWWLIGVQIVRHLKLVDTLTLTISILFLVFGGLGLATYLTTLATVLHWAKKFISKKFMQRINFFLGIILVILSVYFLINSLRVLFGLRFPLFFFSQTHLVMAKLKPLIYAGVQAKPALKVQRKSKHLGAFARRIISWVKNYFLPLDGGGLHRDLSRAIEVGVDRHSHSHPLLHQLPPPS